MCHSVSFHDLRLLRKVLFVGGLTGALIVPAGTMLSQPITLPDSGGRTLPTSAQSGQIERSFQTRAVPQATRDGPVFEGDRTVPPDEVGELSLVLRSVVTEGSTVYSDQDLERLYEDRLGQEITLAEVFRIADEITAKYRNDGYILSRAILPPQTITEGEVRIRIVEGYVNEVRIEGENGEQEQRSLLNSYAAGIENSRPLSIQDLERYLLFIDDLPGISSEAVLRPARDVPGASDLVIVVHDDGTENFVRIDNRGSKFNGPGRLWLGADFNSLVKPYDRTTLRAIAAGKNAKELTYLEVGHERPLGIDGKKLRLQLNHTVSEPGHTLRSLEVESKSYSLRIGVSNPVIRSRARNWSLHADFVVRDSETTIFGNRLSKDRVRFVSVGAIYDSVDRFGGVNMFEAYLDQGLGILGATKPGSTDLSRARARTGFTKVRLSASRLQQLSDRWSLLASITSQFATTSLPASEEFGVGGEHCGRAYDTSEVTGDDGACLTLELRYGHNFGARFLQGYQAYGFYDVGRVRRKDPGALGKTASLTSAGIGARFNFTERLSGSIEVAWPQTKQVDSRPIDVDSKRAFLSLTLRF